MSLQLTSEIKSAARTKSQRPSLAHLPGEEGWPIIGNTLAALKDPVRHVEAMHDKYGPVYRDNLFGERSVALLGPEANEAHRNHLHFDLAARKRGAFCE